ncbi:hypothetical protein ACIRVF_11150 [Kitasatospora sp. NPDC101157]|uniref:hypothetical protein n=1 Tax=Kitasatospora sp. NPDC101157 TaxID=3364098 RepID=UPI00382866DD
MIETRKSYRRRLSEGRAVEIEVVYDDSVSSKTLITITTEAGTAELLLELPDLRALGELVNAAQADFPPF